MEVKQILVAFWWIVALTIAGISFVKIDSLRLEKEPIDVARDIALIINRLGVLDSRGEITYLLEEDTRVELKQGIVEFYNKGVKVADYPFFDKGNVFLSEINGGVVIVKNE